jgi:NADP-dependent 3-hydroxy acid dehydrogenase YdfG
VTPKTQQGNGRIALVSGGTDGLGRATAVMLAEHGFRVFAGGRNIERIAALQQFASERKLQLTAMELEVRDDASVDRAVTQIEKSAGTVDVLVNNAGIAIAAVMEEITLADLRKQFETNFFGLVRMSQRVLPGMRRKLSGRIINMRYELDRRQASLAAVRTLQFEQARRGSSKRRDATGSLSLRNSSGAD